MGLDHGLRLGTLAPSEDGIDWSDEAASKAYFETYSKWREGVEIITWRKANAIHKWFVENVQDGVDDCENYKVTKAQLITMLDLVDRVLAGTRTEQGTIKNGTTYTAATGWLDNMVSGEVNLNPELAAEILPSTSGFFFGSTDYDQWYLDNLRYTSETLTPFLDTMKDDDTVVYWSSW